MFFYRKRNKKKKKNKSSVNYAQLKAISETILSKPRLIVYTEHR